MAKTATEPDLPDCSPLAVSRSMLQPARETVSRIWTQRCFLHQSQNPHPEHVLCFRLLLYTPAPMTLRNTPQTRRTMSSPTFTLERDKVKTWGDMPSRDPLLTHTHCDLTLSSHTELENKSFNYSLNLYVLDL